MDRFNGVQLVPGDLRDEALFESSRALQRECEADLKPGGCALIKVFEGSTFGVR